MRPSITFAALAALTVTACASAGEGPVSYLTARATADVRDCLVVDLSKPERVGLQARPPTVAPKEDGYLLTFPHASPSTFVEVKPQGAKTRVAYHPGAEPLPPAAASVIRACG